MPPPARIARYRSLRTLQLAYGLALALLVAAAGAAGAAGWALNARWAEEARRIDALRQSAAALRGDLHRQTKEVFDRHFLADPAAEAQYRAWGARIAASQARLRALARDGVERGAVDALDRALAGLRRMSEGVMALPAGGVAESERLALFDTRFEGGALAAVEDALARAEAAFFGAEAALEARIAARARLAFAVLFAPVALAALLLFGARRLLQREFVRPLASLLDAMAAYGKGRLDHRESEAGASEMVALQRAVNRMAADLERYRAAVVRGERQAALGALVPAIAHNIRNPLAGIRASAQLLDAAPARGVVAAVDRLSAWLDALLTYLDPSKARRAEASLAACADRALAMLEPRLAGKRLSVARRGWESGGLSWIDARLCEQALYGLLANAVDASPEGGEILLSAGAGGGACWIAIEDRGPGFAAAPESGAPIPGGPYPGPSTKPAGFGLGIPFARKVCELHDGALAFGAAPGGGARVELSMPAAGAAAAEAA